MSDFVRRLGPQLLLDGSPFPIVGTNTYYLAYVDEGTLNGALDLAASFGLNVLRTWAFLDAPTPPGPGEVCFQYWDEGAKAPRVQDGENGLVRLDRAIAQAGARGFRLVLTLTNNWKDFGGMPQYVQWFGMEGKKNHFYTDDRCRNAYRNWVAQIVSRRNTITGLLYSADPAILAWELANEPRCEGFGGTGILVDWVDEMSRFIRGLDPNHLISVGDEGNEKLLEIEEIDFGTFHMYPDSLATGLELIHKYSDAAGRADKPMLLEEYALKDKATRNAVYTEWLRAVEDLNIVGDLVWMTGLPKSVSQPYDPDDYVLSSVADAPAIREHAAKTLDQPAGRSHP